jgi:hypothetical protein
LSDNYPTIDIYSKLPTFQYVLYKQIILTSEIDGKPEKLNIFDRNFKKHLDNSKKMIIVNLDERIEVI